MKILRENKCLKARLCFYFIKMILTLEEILKSDRQYYVFITDNDDITFFSELAFTVCISAANISN